MLNLALIGEEEAVGKCAPTKFKISDTTDRTDISPIA